MPGDLLSLLCWQVIIHITKCSPSCVPGYSLHPPVSRSPYNTLPGPVALPGGTLSRQMWAHIASFPLPQGERTPFFPSNTKKQEKRYHFPPPHTHTSVTNRALCSISQCCLGRDQYSEWRMRITGLQTAEPQSSLCC